MKLGQSLPARRASSRKLSKASSQAAAVCSVPATLHLLAWVSAHRNHQKIPIPTRNSLFSLSSGNDRRVQPLPSSFS